jgi:hypothetical protein
MSIERDLEMPDPQTFLLPSRAYFLSMRDQNVPLREIALADAVERYAECARDSEYVQHLALVALIGEAVQIVEDVGALASSLLDAPLGTAFFAALTNYNPRTVNNFYASLRKRPDSDFMRLLGFHMGEHRLEDAFIFRPALSKGDLAALDEAHRATTRLVRQHLETIAIDWSRCRRPACQLDSPGHRAVLSWPFHIRRIRTRRTRRCDACRDDCSGDVVGARFSAEAAICIQAPD